MSTSDLEIAMSRRSPADVLAADFVDVDVANNVVHVNAVAFQKKLPVVVSPPPPTLPPFVCWLPAYSTA